MTDRSPEQTEQEVDQWYRAAERGMHEAGMILKDRPDAYWEACRVSFMSPEHAVRLALYDDDDDSAVVAARRAMVMLFRQEVRS